MGGYSTRNQWSTTFSSGLPMFSPLNSINNASGNFSMPATMCSCD
jgi:hypothetical protein